MLALLTLTLGWTSASAQLTWTDKTSLITNPSFETDNAISDLTSCGWATDRVTGWTIAPSSSSNAQVGVGNSSSTIQGIGSTFSPSEGDKYFYTRNNWNANTNYSFSQVITRNGDNLKAGLYKVTCKAATYSSDAAFNTLTLGLKEGTGSAVTHDGIVLNVWNTWGVIIYKRADDTNLTIEVNFKPGHDGNSKHYALLMDDFHLEFISEADAFEASSRNTIDFSDIINNAGIYNHSTKSTCPRGWTASKHTTGNGNYTEGEKGDTRLEGWSGGNLDIDYNQTITNLPAGKYTVTAYAHERAEVGKTYVYASTEGKDDATGLVNSATDSDITTSELKVSNGTMKIGIRSTANDWVTADNFRISFLGFDIDAVKAEYETAHSNAINARDAAENANIVGTERTTFEDVITIYTTDDTQSYSWYVDAKEALESAIAAFIAARDSYDALAREISKAEALGFDASEYAATASSTAESALIATQNIKVNEYILVSNTYQYGVDLSEWITEGNTDDNSGQHWDGTTTSKYKEQKNSWGNPLMGYAAPSWSIRFYQRIELPAGNYVFKVAGRKASGTHTTMSLDVTKISDNSSLGLISDFPEGDTGLGINTNGATDYTTGEGHTYANNGAGRGWEWRYVKFTLTETTEVRISVNADATDYNQWMSFCNYTLQTDDDTNISLIEYNVALANAQTVIADDTYKNVTGEERTTLQVAIDADATLDKTDKAAIEDATTALNNKTTAFTDAKAAYDSFATAKAIEYKELPYASPTKFDDIATAQNIADATSASDAITKTNAIIGAYRLYVESNGMAEGIEGVEDKTSLIADPNFENVTIQGTNAGAWKFDQTGGNVNINTNEPFTDGSGSSEHSYFDYYNGSNNNQNVHQVIENLEPGCYLLTATGRGHSNFSDNFQLYVVDKGSVNIPCEGNSGGTFDRGWNDVSLYFVQTETSNVTIGAKTNNSQPQWWGITRFRLVKLPTETVQMTDADSYEPQAYDYANVKLTRNLNKGWNPIILPFAVSADELQTKLGDGYEVAAFNGDEMDENGNVTLMFKKQEAMEANTPYLLYAPNAISTELTFDGVQIVDVTNAGEVARTNFTFVGNYTKYAQGESPIVAGDYIMSGGKLVPSASGGNAIKAFRSYLKKTTQNEVKSITITIDGEDTTGIQTIEMRESTTEGIYNLQGQKVNQAQKGVYIVNGKKVVVK